MAVKRRYLDANHPSDWSSGMMGGGSASWDERRRMVARWLEPKRKKAQDWGAANECFCGNRLYVRWRGRFYCLGCGRYVSHLWNRKGKVWVPAQEPRPAPPGAAAK